MSATDTQRHVQSMLVLDYYGNGNSNSKIETRDILNLGGNVGQICYPFDSGLRTIHKGQRPILHTAANSPVWGIYG